MTVSDVLREVEASELSSLQSAPPSCLISRVQSSQNTLCHALAARYLHLVRELTLRVIICGASCRISRNIVLWALNVGRGYRGQGIASTRRRARGFIGLPSESKIESRNARHRIMRSDRTAQE
jgi:hypothetical protein